jgi:effector-binding domain-containing protein
MTVDFRLKRTPAFQVGSLVRKGPWKKDQLRAEFAQLTRWAKAQKLRTGRWIFYEHSFTHWEACLEVRGRATPSGRIRVKTLPAATAASVVFDPDEVAPRVVYHGLVDWLRARRKEGKVGPVLSVREVYSADPWTHPKAWASAEVQFLVRRK